MAEGAVLTDADGLPVAPGEQAMGIPRDLAGVNPSLYDDVDLEAPPEGQSHENERECYHSRGSPQPQQSAPDDDEGCSVRQDNNR